MGVKTSLYRKRVLITGHSGFKGSWLVKILIKLKCDVYGVSIDQHDNLLNILVKDFSNVTSYFADITDKSALMEVVQKVNPDVVFHFAAQALVASSYINPINTWHTNLFGTLNLFDCLEKLNRSLPVIVATTDKVYSNKRPDREKQFSEDDALGGQDPYSASKASVEILIESWRYSSNSSNLKIASVRAGNVIGGGDFTSGRLMPDIFRSINTKSPIVLRNPNHIRPWQHVLDVLVGYLKVAQLLISNPRIDNQTQFNLAPLENVNVNVMEIAEKSKLILKSNVDILVKEENFKESEVIRLDAHKAKNILNWECIWDLNQTLEKTLFWYRALEETPENISDISEDIILECLKSHAF